MRLSRKTLVLCLVAILLGAVNFLDRGARFGAEGTLPFLPPITLQSATRIEITSAYEKVVLARDEEGTGWSLTAPLTQAADKSHIRAVLQAFRGEVQMDVRVDSDNHKDYGLNASGGLIVEIWSGTEAPEVSLTIGNPAPGGANFVRLSADESVYRARVGGRARFERSAADWRNRALLDFAEDEIQGVSVKPSSGPQLHLVRDESAEGAAVPGPWRIDGGPAVSPADLARLVAAVGHLRATEILGDDFDGGFSPPAAEITVVDGTGTETTLAVGSRAYEKAAFVRIEGQQAVYRVRGRVVGALLRLASGGGPSKTIFQVNPANMAALIYYEGRTQVELGPNESGVWTLRSPAGLTIDVKDIEWARMALSRPAAVGIAAGMSDGSTGLSRPKMVIEVQRADGSHEALYVGRAFMSDGDVRFYVKRQGGDKIYEMDEPMLSRIRRAFGQG
jgi:hypothetical protein